MFLFILLWHLHWITVMFFCQVSLRWAFVVRNAHILTGSKKYDHISPVLVFLYCFPVHFRGYFSYFIAIILIGACSPIWTRKTLRSQGTGFQTTDYLQSKRRPWVHRLFIFVHRQFLNCLPQTLGRLVSSGSVQREAKDPVVLCCNSQFVMYCILFISLCYLFYLLPAL